MSLPVHSWTSSQNLKLTSVTSWIRPCYQNPDQETEHYQHLLSPLFEWRTQEMLHHQGSLNGTQSGVWKNMGIWYQVKQDDSEESNFECKNVIFNSKNLMLSFNQFVSLFKCTRVCEFLNICDNRLRALNAYVFQF